jgi:Flp pilus assembly protein TadG
MRMRRTGSTHCHRKQCWGSQRHAVIVLVVLVMPVLVLVVVAVVELVVV